jgi:hypothetical protein
LVFGDASAKNEGGIKAQPQTLQQNSSFTYHCHFRGQNELDKIPWIASVVMKMTFKSVTTDESQEILVNFFSSTNGGKII